MPNLEQIKQQEFTLPVNVLGNIILVTYKPFGITMDASIQQLMAQQQNNMTGLYDAFCDTISAWDLYEDDQQNMVPITPQRLSLLPGTLVMLLLEACMNDKSERQVEISAKQKDDSDGLYVPEAELGTVLAALDEAIQIYDSETAKMAWQVLNLLQATEV